MSEEEAKTFLKKVGEDKELQEKLKGVDSEEKLFAVAKEAGFDFTKKEWRAISPRKADVELTDDDLGEVAGGTGLTQVRACQPTGYTCWYEGVECKPPHP